MTKEFTGYVLAGGKSARMKKDKALLETGGETFLHRAVRTLSGVGENPVRIVLRRAQTAIAERVSAANPIVFDVLENRGALGGVHAALADCPTEYAVILAVDLPLVPTEAVERLTEIALLSDKFVAVVPRQTDGRRQPLCAVYHARRCLPPLEKLLGENDSASAQDFLEIIRPRVVDQNNLTAGDLKDIFFNVNRPADLERLDD